MLLSSCGPNYKYEAGLIRYLSDIGIVTIGSKEQRNVYLLDLRSCDTCLTLSIGMLSSIKCHDKLNVVLTSIPYDLEVKNRVLDLYSNHRVYWDSLGLIYKYETGFGKPMYVELKGDKALNVLSIKDSEIEQIQKSLISKLDCRLN